MVLLDVGETCLLLTELEVTDWTKMELGTVAAVDDLDTAVVDFDDQLRADVDLGGDDDRLLAQPVKEESVPFPGHFQVFAFGMLDMELVELELKVGAAVSSIDFE